MKEGNEGEENIKERKAWTCPSPAIESVHGEKVQRNVCNMQ
jgi:hypothetical protein